VFNLIQIHAQSDHHPNRQKPRATPSDTLCADGAQREGRTPTLLREPDFESGASASSAIRAYPFKTRIFLARSHVRVNPLPSFLSTTAVLQSSRTLT